MKPLYISELFNLLNKKAYNKTHTRVELFVIGAHTMLTMVSVCTNIFLCYLFVNLKRNNFHL